MISPIIKSALFSYVFCITSYFVTIFTNEESIKEYLNLLDISFAKYDQIIFFRLLGQATGAIILLIFIREFSLKKIITCNVLLYFISIYAIIFIEISHTTILFYFFIYSATIVITSALLLGYILIDNKIKNNYAISIYIISLLIGYMISECVSYFAMTNVADISYFQELILSDFVPMSVFLLVLYFSPVYSKTINLEVYRFFPVIRRMKMEIIITFVIFYVCMIIQDGYHFYASSRSLVIFSDLNEQYIRLFAIVIAIILVNLYMERFNQYKIHIICLISMILIFVSIPNWAKYLLPSIFCRIALIIGLYTLFASNLLIITQKFRQINIFSAISIYALSAVFGYYCGYITINSTEETIGINGFLISTCFVLLSLLLYYLYLFKQYKLYK